MRRAPLYLLSIIMLASLLAGGATVAAQSTQVLVVPPSSQMAPGASVTVEVQVRDVVDLYAVDIRLAFDPAVVEVVDADGDSSNGTQITAGGFLRSVYGFTAANGADNATGDLRYIYSLLSPAAPVSGSGVLASITFRARDPGTSTLRLSVLLANGLAEYIPAVVSDGSIVVTGNTATPTITVGATSTPTLTRTPTRTATLVATPTRTATSLVTLTPSPTITRAPTRTGTPPIPDHFAWLPLLLRAHSVPTLTPLPSATPTRTPTMGPTLTATSTAVGTPSPTGGFTPAATPSATPTPTASALPSATMSATPGATRSPTPTPTATSITSPTITATPARTVTVSPTPQSRQLLLNPSFETDAAWTLEGGSVPVYTMARARSGQRSMRLGIIMPTTQKIWSSIWQGVDLPGYVTGARLSFYYYPSGWPEDADDIYVYVTRAADGATLFSQRWMQWEQVWHSYTVDLLSQLQPYAGQRIRLRIGVYNNDDGMTAVYVDDVELVLAGSGFPAAGNE